MEIARGGRMKWYKATIELTTVGKGLYAFTDRVNGQIRAWNVREGMCYFSALTMAN
jgi:thiamine phosphate synthase YjbQ (UPF0047 family)